MKFIKNVITFIYERLCKGFFTKEYWVAEYPYDDYM
jgi:hypothetical protein